jgi:two-component system sensor histidine kinase GlrK
LFPRPRPEAARAPRGPFGRLAARLLLSHATLAGALFLALGITVAALVRMTSLVGDIREIELKGVESDQELHRAAWAIEVAARHGASACDQGDSSALVGARLRGAKGSLDTLLARSSGGDARRMHTAAHRYAELARRASGPDACEVLRSAAHQRERLLLDEELTEAWIERIVQLNRLIEAKDDEARRIGNDATRAATAVAVLFWAAGLGVTVWMARGVTAPLGRLAGAARRMGEGDFAPIPAERGAAEVVDLARELERMRARLAELEVLKQGFVASVSHELRSPLASLREALGLMADGTAGPMTPQQHRVIGAAQRACERQIRTITALLDLSRLRSGRPVVLQGGCDIDRIVNVALDDEREAAAARDVTCLFEAEGAAPVAVMDGALTERACANLVRNAVSVTPAGKTVRVRRTTTAVGPSGRAGRWARVEIADEGPGVPEAIQRSLFDAFVAHDVRGPRARGGVGLGLALAREAMRAQGGEVELAQSSERGATFVMWVDLAQRQGGEG